MIVAAFALNGILPAMPEALSSTEAVEPGFSAAFFHWLESSLWLCVKIFGIIISLMIIQRLLEEFGVIEGTLPLICSFNEFIWFNGFRFFFVDFRKYCRFSLRFSYYDGYAKLGKLEKKEADLFKSSFGRFSFTGGRSFVVYGHWFASMVVDYSPSDFSYSGCMGKKIGVAYKIYLYQQASGSCEFVKLV